MKKILRGKVIGSKMDKTVKVEMERLVTHPLYKKRIKKRTRVFAHDQQNQAKAGDLVEIIQCSPLSKKKRWRILKILTSL